MKSEFKGGVLELFVWNLLVVFVSIISLGIAYPWIRVGYLKWYYGKTYINGQQLSFDGNGGSLFGSYIKWFLLCIITFGIYGWWLTVNLIKWETKHIHFVGQSGVSEFKGTVWDHFVLMLINEFLISITLSIYFPWAVAKIQRWKTSNQVIDGKQLSFDGDGAQLLGNYIKWFLLTIITIGIYGLWLNKNMIVWTVEHTHAAE